MQTQYTEQEEISLKDLIIVFVKKWKLILGLTVLFVLIAGVYAFFISDTVYESEISGSISIPESVTTEFGTYEFPSKNYSDYLALLHSKEVLVRIKNSLKIGGTLKSVSEQLKYQIASDSSRFTFIAQGKTPQEAKALLEAATAIYLDHVNMTYKSQAIQSLLHSNYLTIEQTQLQIEKYLKELEGVKGLLKDTPKSVPLKKLLVMDPILAQQIANERNLTLEDLANVTMEEEEINPNYTALEGDMVVLNKAINTLIIQKNTEIAFRKELEAEADAVNTYLSKGDDSSLNKDKLEVIKTYIQLTSQASLPEVPVAPRRILILSMGLMLGLGIGTAFAFFQSYWEKEISNHIK